MRPIVTQETNHNFGPPPGREGEFRALPCAHPVETKHGPVTYAVYELDDADREAIAAGWNIRLGVGWIGGFPPVSLAVTYLTETKEGDNA